MQLSPNTTRTLAFVADAYIPILLMLALFCVLQSCRADRKWPLAQFVYAVSGVYVLMFADNYLRLWPAWGLDYSTHSAAAFALVMVIVSNQRLNLMAPYGASLLMYGWLMWVLNYHSWVDMITTLMVVSFVLLPFWRLGKPA